MYTRHSQALEIPVPLGADGAPQDWDRRDGFGEQEFVGAAAASKQGGREGGRVGGGACAGRRDLSGSGTHSQKSLVVTLCNTYTRGVHFQNFCVNMGLCARRGVRTGPYFCLFVCRNMAWCAREVRMGSFECGTASPLHLLMSCLGMPGGSER